MTFKIVDVTAPEAPELKATSSVKSDAVGAASDLHAATGRTVAVIDASCNDEVARFPSRPEGNDPSAVRRPSQANPPPAAMARGHMHEATPLHMAIVYIFGFLAAACIGGGTYGIVRGSLAETKFVIGGASLSTQHVGVAFVGIGLVIAYQTVRLVLKSQHDLARLPADTPRRRRKRGGGTKT